MTVRMRPLLSSIHRMNLLFSLSDEIMIKSPRNVTKFLEECGLSKSFALNTWHLSDKLLINYTPS